MLNPRNRLSSSLSTNPFTETQWKELEHQALIFKYIISGVQIPPHLISTLNITLGGCGYYQVGYGRKVDAEPGRCRRTDGKKWRCSKEAYLESKYCEKHMHRGKKRLKMSAEAVTTSSITTTTATNTSSSSSSLYSSLPYHHSVSSPSVSSGSSFRPSCSVLSSQSNSSNQQMFLDSGSYDSHGDHKDYRYMNGMQESYGAESLGTFQSLPESYNPGYSQQQQQHCSAMRSDYHRNEGQKQTMHHFMSENLPNKTRDSWLDLGDNSQSISTTQLSISPPMSSSNHHHYHHLFQPNFTLHQWYDK